MKKLKVSDLSVGMEVDFRGVVTGCKITEIRGNAIWVDRIDGWVDIDDIYPAYTQYEEQKGENK